MYIAFANNRLNIVIERPSMLDQGGVTRIYTVGRSEAAVKILTAKIFIIALH